jgi:methionine synthase II (cobalamin-independent)
MQLILANAGGYPHSGASEDLQVLLRARADVDRGEKTAVDLIDAENFMVRRAIDEQVAAGLELITDGLTRWRDAISHLAGKLEGVRLGAQKTFPGGIGTYRVPLLTARPVRRTSLLGEEYRFACNALGALGTPAGRAGRLAVKAVLTGPYSLAKLSEAEHPSMKALDARAEAFAEALAAEFEALCDAGAENIQVDEPAPLEQESAWLVFRRAIEALAGARDAARRKGRKTELTLCVPHSGAAPHYEQLCQLPIDVLSLDFTDDSHLLDRVAAAGAPKTLHLGLVSGRNAQVEDASALSRKIEALLPKITAGRAFIGPSWGLESVPRESARAKLELIARVRKAFSPSTTTA